MDDFWLTHVSVWLSGACFSLALAGKLRADPKGRDWPAWYRGAWSLGCGLLWTHVTAVWFVIHRGAWSAAWEHTAQATFQATGVATGAGIWFNFLTLAIWTFDCLVPGARAARDRQSDPPRDSPVFRREEPAGRSAPVQDVIPRSGGLDDTASFRPTIWRMWSRCVPLYLAGMWFQAGVVFATGWTRWAGWGLTVGLLAAAVLPRRKEIVRRDAGEP